MYLLYQGDLANILERSCITVCHTAALNCANKVPSPSKNTKPSPNESPLTNEITIFCKGDHLSLSHVFLSLCRHPKNIVLSTGKKSLANTKNQQDISPSITINKNHRNLQTCLASSRTYLQVLSTY